MLITRDGLFGSIGGGALEHVVIAQSRKLLDDRFRSTLYQSYPLGPLLGQCCGGRVSVLIEKLDKSHIATLNECERVASDEMDNVKLVSSLRGEKVNKVFRSMKVSGPCLLNDNYEQLSDEISRDTDRRGLYFLESLTSHSVDLYIFGAGHVGKAVIRLMEGLPFNVYWNDERVDMFPAIVPSNVHVSMRHDYETMIKEASESSFFLVFTHLHSLDFQITAAILQNRVPKFCGLIASQTKRRSFQSRFQRDRNLNEDQIAHLTCPIGINGIEGKEPEVIAVSVVAQILSCYYSVQKKRSSHDALAC